MAKLHQRKDESGFYILGGLPGTGSIVTWQLTSEGVTYLRSRGYEGVGATIPMKVLQELKERGHAYTHGSGVGRALPVTRLTRTDLPDGMVSRSSAAALVLIERDGSWEMAILVAEIPRSWASAEASLVEALSGWHLGVPGGASVPATQLWPGRGGALIQVEPQMSSYSVEPTGRWPAGWDVVGWLADLPGLSLGGTLFREEGGDRLPPGSAIEAGEAYVLVARADDQGRQEGCSPPPSLAPKPLGVRGGWGAWAVKLPHSADAEVRRWANLVGHHISQPRYRLALITPPLRYSEEGLPVIASDIEAVFALSPSVAVAGAEVTTTFHTVQFSGAGSFRIAIDDTLMRPLDVVVERRAAVTEGRFPAALEVDIDLGGARVTLHALRDGVGPHMIELPARAPGEPLPVIVRCATQIDVLSTLGATVERIDGLTDETASAYLASKLGDATRRAAHMCVQLDAWAFGRLRLEFVVRSVPEVDSLDLPPGVARRARWIAATLQGRGYGDDVIPLSAWTRTGLRRLSTLRGCAGLRDLQRAPRSLLPHVNAIVRLAQEQNIEVHHG